MHEPGTATEVLAVDAQTHAQLLSIRAIDPAPWDGLEIVPPAVPTTEEIADPRPGPAGAEE